MHITLCTVQHSQPRCAASEHSVLLCSGNSSRLLHVKAPLTSTFGSFAVQRDHLEPCIGSTFQRADHCGNLVGHRMPMLRSRICMALSVSKSSSPEHVASALSSSTCCNAGSHSASCAASRAAAAAAPSAVYCTGWLLVAAASAAVFCAMEAACCTCGFASLVSSWIHDQGQHMCIQVLSNGGIKSGWSPPGARAAPKKCQAHNSQHDFMRSHVRQSCSQ